MFLLFYQSSTTLILLCLVSELTGVLFHVEFCQLTLDYLLWVLIVSFGLFLLVEGFLLSELLLEGMIIYIAIAIVINIDIIIVFDLFCQ